MADAQEKAKVAVRESPGTPKSKGIERLRKAHDDGSRPTSD